MCIGESGEEGGIVCEAGWDRKMVEGGGLVCRWGGSQSWRIKTGDK